MDKKDKFFKKKRENDKTFLFDSVKIENVQKYLSNQVDLLILYPIY